MRLSAIRGLQFKWPKQGQAMVVPVTYSANLSQMPFRYYFKTGWFFRYYIYANILIFPLIVYIDRKVNSPAAVAAWNAKQKADHDKEHIDHMWKDISGYYANR